LKQACAITLFVLAALLMLLAGAIGFGVSSRDQARVTAFADAVRRWQVQPDFRAVQREYVSLGVDAMRARLCGLSGESIVMGFRSLPGLPESLSVKDSSAAHYRAFAAGEMPAYLHLSSEQDVINGLRMIEGLGQRKPLSDESIIKFLSDFKLPVPVVTDAGAVASVRSLVADAQPSMPFVVREHFIDALGPRCISAASMTVLDDSIRRNNRELWRTKQVSDFLSGIWAQGYGVIYLNAIQWFWRIQTIARITCIGLLAAMAVWVIRRSRTAPPESLPAGALVGR
jgi:hypothetical protein